MRIVADESVYKPIVMALRDAGLSVDYILEDYQGMDDMVVLEIANRQNAILLTVDKDFGELIFRQKFLSYGIILLRLKDLSNEEKKSLVLTAFEKHKRRFEHSFT